MKTTTKKNTSKKMLWYGEIPGIFGCGIHVVSDSKEGAMKGLREGYKRWKKIQPDPTTNFKTSFEHWGGHVSMVELDKPYSDYLGNQ